MTQPDKMRPLQTEVSVSLRQRPKVTPRMIAANRANAQKSTGPRTGIGKARVAINALGHGKYTDKLFRSHLLLAREDVGLYDWMTARFVTTSAR